MSQTNEEKPMNENVPMNNINNDDETLLKNDVETTTIDRNTLDEKMNAENLDVESGEKTTGTKRLSMEAIRSAALTAAEDILDNPRNRVILIITGGLLLFLLLLVCAILIFSCPDDKTYRFIRLVPKPRGPNNMIHFVHGGDGTDGGAHRWQAKVDQINEFLRLYRRPIGTTHCPIISGGRKAVNMSDNTVCNFDLNSVAKDCLSGDYGYKAGAPCIFIVFNNIENWIPTSEIDKTNTNISGETLSDRFVTVECNPEHSFDHENAGTMEFTPYQGFSSMFFPYKGQENYLSPFVVLKLAAPTHNTGISISCKLIAPNLYHESDARFRTEEPVPFIPFTVFIE